MRQQRKGRLDSNGEIMVISFDGVEEKHELCLEDKISVFAECESLPDHV